MHGERNRWLNVSYEMPEGGGGDPAPPADPPAGGDPAADAGGGWQGPAQDEWGRVTSFMEQAAPTLSMLGELLNDPGDPGAQQQGQPQLDPSDPASVQGYLDSQVERLFQERVAPFQPLLGQIAEREGEQAARGRLDELAGTIGSFDRDQALVTAQVLLQQGLQPDQALEQAARRQFTSEQKFRETIINEYKASLGAAATAAPGAPADGGAANETQQVDGRARDRYDVALARGMSRMNPVTDPNLL